MKLDEVSVNRKVRVVDMSLVDGIHQQRLMNLGVVVGSEIIVKCKTPFRGPMMIECNNQSVGLRCKCCHQIVVEKVQKDK